MASMGPFEVAFGMRSRNDRFAAKSRETPELALESAHLQNKKIIFSKYMFYLRLIFTVNCLNANEFGTIRVWFVHVVWDLDDFAGRRRFST